MVNSLPRLGQEQKLVNSGPRLGQEQKYGVPVLI
jgi:hypothetical protein